MKSKYIKCIFKDILFCVPWDNQNIVFTGSADSEISEEQKKEKLSELRKKEQEIRDILSKKTKELKKICLREAVRLCTTLLLLWCLSMFCSLHV